VLPGFALGGGYKIVGVHSLSTQNFKVYSRDTCPSTPQLATPLIVTLPVLWCIMKCHIIIVIVVYQFVIVIKNTKLDFMLLNIGVQMNIWHNL